MAWTFKIDTLAIFENISLIVVAVRRAELSSKFNLLEHRQFPHLGSGYHHIKQSGEEFVKHPFFSSPSTSLSIQINSVAISSGRDGILFTSESKIFHPAMMS